MKKNQSNVFSFRKSIIKISRVMKLASFFLLVGFLQVKANTYSQTDNIKLTMQEATLSDVIKEIQKQTEFTFFYSPEDVREIIVPEIEVEKASLEEVLDLCLKGTNISYEIVRKAVILKKTDKKKLENVVSDTASLQQPQKKEILGIVSDSKGQPFPGVSIVVKGTTIGVTTDLNGKFKLNVPNDTKTLVFSFVGMKTQEVAVSEKAQMTVQMEEEAFGLEEVIVVGYGTQTKVSVVGSISSVKIADIKSIASTNLTNTIGGRISGIITKMGEGKPGFDNSQIFIRGKATLNNSAPLILVDGIESDFGRISPNDIESFSVLKDASATAVYGVRGANGVILITTKRGTIGKPKIQINSQFRLYHLVKYPKFPNAYEFANLYNEAWLNGGNASKFYTEDDLAAFRDHTDPYGHPDVDWYNTLIKPYYPEHQHDINISGGTARVKYYVAGEIVSQDGCYRQWDNMRYNSNASYDRINVRMNYDFAVTKTTDLSVNFSNRVENTNDVNSSGTFGNDLINLGLFDEINQLAPIANVPNNPDGSYGFLFNYGNNAVRPYSDLQAGGYTKSRKNFMQASFNLNQKLDSFTKGLSFRLMGGLNTNYGYNYKLTEFPSLWHYNSADESYTEVVRSTLPYYSISADNINKLLHIETGFNYDRTFNKIHKITALALYNQDRNIVGANAPVNHLGIAGRLTYGYRNKYLGEINVGYNGSDQFQKGQRFALLPAGSVGWVVSEENFWKMNVPFINYLKLRGSYGTAGNDQLGGYSYLYKAVYNEASADQFTQGYYFGDNATPYNGLKEGTLGNDKVTWEIAVKQNYGIDFSLLNSALGFSFDYFIEHRSNILATRNTITDAFGMLKTSLPPENIGEVENKGFEVETKYDKKFNDLEIHLSGNISFARNKIIYQDEITQPYDYMMRTGQSIGQYYGYKWTGKFYSYEDLGYVWDESVTAANKYVLPDGAVPLVPVPASKVYPGDLMFVDRNGDGVLDSYDVGYIRHTPTPEIIYGINTGINYKGFGFQMFWQGAGRFSVNLGPLMTEFNNGGTIRTLMEGRWAYFPEDGIDTRATATYPRLMIDGAPQTRLTSDFKIFDGRYIRLKNVEISYTLPEKLVKSLKMESARIYLTGSNLITIDNMKGFIDPEATGGVSSYPQSLYYGIGVNLGF